MTAEVALVDLDLTTQWSAVSTTAQIVGADVFDSDLLRLLFNYQFNTQ